MSSVTPGNRTGWRSSAMPSLGTEARMLVRGESRTHEILRSRIAQLAAMTLIVDAVGTLLMFMLEHSARGSDFDDLGGALFWVTTQLTTVSSQMNNPVTTGGRFVDVVLQIWGIVVAATLAGAFASF